ncbi:MAG TPA: radical SAM protein, partial [Tepidisphaeraceae bacterium]|nr:radical SAM protein [Tepidisphaeraceae bacterium]
MSLLEPGLIIPYVFDLELSGRCNTVCTFCPREEMKRGEQLMSAENFEHFFRNLKEYVAALEGERVSLPHERSLAVLGAREQSPVRILLCGMGESLIHPRCAEWVGRIRREIGVRLSIVTNGLMLKETMVEKLAEAQVTVLFVSVPGVDAESYTRYVPLPWDRVVGNIERAHARLPGRVQINVPIPDDATFTADQAIAFWGAKGIPIASITHCHNRGGFLNNVELTGRFGSSASHFCGILARHNFVAWDGRVLSCCHDLHAENVLGHVAEQSFL